MNGCPPCKAVGREFLGRTNKGEEIRVMQTERPSACVLCSVSTGTHAMHPLYDVDGKKGRQLVLPNGQLAWVHTLCANAICQHHIMKGCVYGCDVTGSSSEDASSDGNSDDDEDDGLPVDVTTHHYVICNPKDTDWWRQIRASRRLKCIDCGKKDNGLRIPVQCTAGDKEEYADFRGSHQGLDISCTQAMHVGCAMWGGGRGSHRRIYFYPGSSTSDPVEECYCPQHARDIGAREVAGTGDLRRRASDSTVGYSQLEDAAGVKKGLESSKRSGETFAPPRVPRAGTTGSTQPVKRRRHIHVLAPLPPLRANGKPESRPSNNVTGIAPARTSDEKSKKPAPERVARSSSAPSTLLQPLPIPEKQAPATTVTAREILAIDNALAVNPLSASVPRKKLNAASRSLGSYVASAQNVVPVSRNTNTTNQQRTSTKPIMDLPQAPRYQRISSVARIAKDPNAGKKRRKISVDIIDDAGFDDDAETTLSPTKSKSVRRRYISESKVDDDFYPDDFDWLGTMTSDVETSLSLAKKVGIDASVVLDARRYYWRRRSGIYGSDFVQLWDQVNKKFAMDRAPQDDVGLSESDCAISIEHYVDEDVDHSELPGNNKWANLSTESSSLFQFGDWDSETQVQKRGAQDVCPGS